MLVLGFDLGATGAAVLLDSGEPEAVDTWLWAYKGDRVQRAVAFRGTLETIICEATPDAVIFERPFTRGLAATRSLWGMAGVLESVMGSVAPIVDALPSEIKKYATGKGGAKKDEMLDAAEQLGYSALTEHAADAFLAAHYGINHIEIGG